MKVYEAVAKATKPATSSLCDAVVVGGEQLTEPYVFDANAQAEGEGQGALFLVVGFIGWTDSSATGVTLLKKIIPNAPCLVKYGSSYAEYAMPIPTSGKWTVTPPGK